MTVFGFFDEQFVCKSLKYSHFTKKYKTDVLNIVNYLKTNMTQFQATFQTIGLSKLFNQIVQNYEDPPFIYCRSFLPMVIVLYDLLTA